MSVQSLVFGIDAATPPLSGRGITIRLSAVGPLRATVNGAARVARETIPGDRPEARLALPRSLLVVSVSEPDQISLGTNLVQAGGLALFPEDVLEEPDDYAVGFRFRFDLGGGLLLPHLFMMTCRQYASEVAWIPGP